MTDIKTIAVIGAGIGGFLLVAHLGSAGYKIRLHDVDEARLTDLRTRGGVETEGLGGGFAPLELATTDLSATVKDADLIVVVTGGHRQSALAKSLAPLLRDGQTVLLIQGNTGGSLVFRRVLNEAGCRAAIDLAEMDNYPYSGRRLGPVQMKPVVTKRWLQIASFPGNRIDTIFAKLAPLFPTAVPAKNIIHTGFTNANAMLHVANCVANATRIEHGQPYEFYAQGVTPAVARVYSAINVERVKAAKALGETVLTLEAWFERVYKVSEPTLVEAFQKLTYNSDGPYGGTPTPKSLESNFVGEDVPVGLIPMMALGNVAGVEMPAMRALIDMAAIMSGNTYAASARTLERMGLAGKDVAGIAAIVDRGFEIE